MQLSLENPDYRYICRGVSPSGVLVNNLELRTSFILAPNQTDWNTGPCATCPRWMLNIGSR